MQATTSELADLFFRILPQVMRAIKADIRKSDLGIDPLHIHLLERVSEREHSLGELAEIVSVSPPTMSNTVSALESRGWVERRRSDGDRRIVFIRVTAKGIGVLSEAKAYLVARFAEVLSELSDEQCQELGSGLTILDEAFSKTTPALVE